MKILLKKKNNLLFDIKNLEKISNTSIYNLINIISKRAKIINKNIRLYTKEILLLLKIKNYKNKKDLKNKILNINNLPNPLYLAIIELLKKNKKNEEKNIYK
ncbi:MAG: hypothetical protein NHF88_01035 [Candidatus Shikimatogenerans bostrichidophilus]|nr:MAG: hypothetical protein NHF88_01035 [Candidatus Shikimatogenerans bostrichidophilus]